MARRRKLSTRKEAAEILAVHPQTITKWEASGLPVAQRGGRGRPSKYDVEEIRAWLDARDAEARRAVDGAGGLDPLKEKANREHYQAKLLEQTFQLRQRELLPAHEVERQWLAEIAGVRALLLALPVTRADRVHRAATLEGLAGVERELQAAVKEVLRQLAGRDEDDEASA